MRMLSADITPAGKSATVIDASVHAAASVASFRWCIFRWQPNKDERPAPPSGKLRQAPITRSLQMHDAVADGADDGVGAVQHAELREQAFEAELHRVLADGEVIGDLLVAAALGQQLQHGQFAGREFRAPETLAEPLGKNCIPTPLSRLFWMEQWF